MIHERTYLTTNTELHRMLDRAKRDGFLDSLYWFVEVKIPGAKTRGGKPVLQAACWPGAWVPVVPVGSEPEVSRHWAEILKAMFEEGNAGTGCEHALALTDAERLAGLDWYEFGSAVWDCICCECGAVFASTAANADWCGCEGEG
jgi:hypothetical protein